MKKFIRGKLNSLQCNSTQPSDRALLFVVQSGREFISHWKQSFCSQNQLKNMKHPNFVWEIPFQDLLAILGGTNSQFYMTDFKRSVQRLEDGLWPFTPPLQKFELKYFPMCSKRITVQRHGPGSPLDPDIEVDELSYLGQLNRHYSTYKSHRPSLFPAPNLSASYFSRTRHFLDDILVW